MVTSKFKELFVSGKLTLIIRVTFLTLILLTSLMGTGVAFADPDPGPVGG
jgi:hypothetical protein